MAKKLRIVLEDTILNFNYRKPGGAFNSTSLVELTENQL